MSTNTNTMTVTKDFRFEAAHSLPHLPEGHKCRYVHGHSYRFRVECTGPLDPRGFVVDYAEISDAVAPLLEQLDHNNVNAVLGPKFSTAENLASWIFAELREPLPTLSGVVVFETASTSVVYRPTPSLI